MPDTNANCNRQWEYIHLLDDNSHAGDGKARGFAFGVRMENVGCGIFLTGRNPQMIAKGDFAGAAAVDEDWDPAIASNNAVDYKCGLLATVAIETDDRVTGECRVNTDECGGTGGTGAAPGLDRVMVISVPYARLDVRLPGTVTDIDTNGDLVDDEYGTILRDDRNLLKDIATAACEWYGTKRQALQLGWKQVDPLGINLGDLVTAIGSTYSDPDVNSVVSEITYTLNEKEGSTQIETSFADMDFSTFGPQK